MKMQLITRSHETSQQKLSLSRAVPINCDIFETVKEIRHPKCQRIFFAEEFCQLFKELCLDFETHKNMIHHPFFSLQ
jgi:hypothetical protein